MALRILIADDEPDARSLLEFNLHRAGFEVVSAQNGEEALRLALANPPDVAVLDVMMPALDGFAVCEFLRHDPRTAHVPVILLTAFSTPEAREIGRQQGADEYLVKPIKSRELIQRIESILSAHKAAAKMLS